MKIISIYGAEMSCGIWNKRLSKTILYTEEAHKFLDSIESEFIEFSISEIDEMSIDKLKKHLEDMDVELELVVS